MNDTTGTGIPTVETQATDAPGAKDGPITAAEDPYTLLGGFVKNRSLITADEHFAGPFEKLMDRAAACIAGRITPEADEQTDSKGRTLVEIDAELVVLSAKAHAAVQWMRELDERTEKLESLIAARVPKPCEPSKATGENELATAVEGADWREALVTLQFLPDGTKWLYTPDRKLFWSGGMWVGGCEDGGRAIVDDDEWIAEARRTCTDPPNLREWWPAKADDFKPTPEQQRFLASVCESCRSVVRAMLAKGDIPGVCKTGN